MTKFNRALIIDDDAFNLEVLKRLLSAEGLTSVAVQDVTRLDTTLAQNGKIDVVFLDLEMPHMDGYKVCGLLRSVLGRDVPIVACTVHVNEISNVRSNGFDSFICKPLDSARFSEQFQRIANGHQVWEY